MMNEKKVLYRVGIKLLIVAICGFLYSMGGTEGMGGLWLRRFLAPGILCGSAFAFSHRWEYLIQMPLMMFSLALGYGADTTWVKIIRRAIFGLANGVTANAYVLYRRAWFTAGAGIVVITAGCIGFGVWGTLASARAEEALIGALIALAVMMNVKDKE